MADQCMYETYAATRFQPAEFCDEDAMDGYDFCEDHAAQLDGPDPDYARDLAYDLAMEDR